MPFELHGRDEENVPIFTGAPEASAPWFFTIGVSVLFIAAILFGGTYALAVQRDILRFLAALSVGGLLAGSVAVGSIWWFRLLREIPHLASLQELGSQFGLEERSLRDHVLSCGVRPRVRINGENLYRPADFGDFASLLRPSAKSPADPRSLLRAGVTAEDVNLLPRPADIGMTQDDSVTINIRLPESD